MKERNWTKTKKSKNKEDKSKRKKTNRGKTQCRVYPEGILQTPEKKEPKQNTTTYYQSKTENWGNLARKPEHKHTLQVASAVCGTSNIARSPLLVRPGPLYPVCHLRPEFVNYVPPLGVRQWNKQSRLFIRPRYTTPLTRLIKKEGK